MLENPIKRESVKATGAAMAIVAGGRVAAALVIALGVAVEALGVLGEKRAKELFDSERLVKAVTEKIATSDDFASLVFDIWSKHNFESSEKRRKYLKSILEKATYDDITDYENFSRIISVSQMITTGELLVTHKFYEPETYKYTKLGIPQPQTFALNFEDICELLSIPTDVQKREKIIDTMNQLGHYGLVAVAYNSMDGPYYRPNTFGKTFLAYIDSLA